MAATKSASTEILPTRRGVLALLGGLALAPLAAAGPADAEPRGQDFVIRDGWILRSDDVARIGLA
jgi:hypothetical protein